MSGFPMPGQRIGPFLIVREVGRGPTGVVLEGLDTTAAPGRERVALKVRTPRTVLAEGLRSRYGADLDALAGTRLPRLLPVLRVGAHEDRLLTVTPYVAGGDVAARLAAGPVEPAVALAWATALAEGLAAVHEAGLVHGAVHARNLLLPAEGTEPVLADVGGALLAQDWLRPPGVGTADAVPPEGPDPSRAADVWAAGRLVEALMGSAAAVPAVAEVVRRATATDPAARHADGGALARALRLVPPGEVARGGGAGRRGLAVGRGVGRGAAQHAPRRKAVVATVGVAAAAAVVATLTLAGHGSPPAPASGGPGVDARPGAAVASSAAPPAVPQLGHAPGYRSVVFTLRAPAGAEVQVDRGSGWEEVATRTVTLPTAAGGDRACLRARSVVGGRRSATGRDCGRSQPPELSTERHADCLVDGAYRQVCYTLLARGFAPGEDPLTFTVDGRPEGTATVHIGRDGTGTLPGGQHFHFADSDAGATARIEMAGVTYAWQVASRG